MDTAINFFRTAISDNRVGAISRSSKYVIRAVLKDLGAKPLSLILEFGPGDGVMTRELLKHLSPNGSLVAVESNADFRKTLRKIRDPRLRVINGKVQNILPKLNRYGFLKVDAVVSSIPFSLLTQSEREEIVTNTFRSLSVGGKFIIFHQYTPLMLRPLKKLFKKVKLSFEPRNILPCFIMCGQKTKDRMVNITSQ